MKNLNEFITESKDKPLYGEYDIKQYLDYCIQKWIQRINGYNYIFTDISQYTKVELCRQCEIVLNIIEKFASDINLHFYNAESKEDKKKYCAGGYENAVYTAFKVIEKVLEVDTPDDNNTKVDIDAEIKELKTRFEKLVNDCNKKYKDYIDNLKPENVADGCAIPCTCDCKCCCGY